MLGQPAQALFVPKRPPSAVPPLQKNAMEQTVENELSKRKAPLYRGALLLPIDGLCCSALEGSLLAAWGCLVNRPSVRSSRKRLRAWSPSSHQARAFP